MKYLKVVIVIFRRNQHSFLDFNVLNYKPKYTYNEKQVRGLGYFTGLLLAVSKYQLLTDFL
jgi:hypothetical protein